MRKDERAALIALLDNVGLGFTKCMPECKMLREFLKRTHTKDKAPAKKAKAKR